MLWSEIKNGWSNRLREERAEIADNLRTIGGALLWAANDLRVNVRAFHRRNVAFVGRLLEKPDPTRFATTPPDWWDEKRKSGKMQVPKTERPNGKELRDLDDVLRGFALNFDEVRDENGGVHLEAEVLWGDVANAAKSGDVEITESEWFHLQNYSARQRLSDLETAKQVKRRMLRGMSEAEISEETGIKLNTVKKYRSALKRAEKASPADETE